MKRLCWLVLVLLAGCAKPPAPPPEGYRNLDSTVAYAGIEACRACHADKYEAFTRAQMGRSFRPATASASDARWDGVAPLHDAARDLYYQPFRRGEALFVREYRLDGRDTVHQRVERIDYIVGSGQHTNSHLMSVNGYLYQMPLTWYAQQQRWSLPPQFDEGNNYRFGRPIPMACMACHNAMPAFVPGSENRFGALPHGIDCERCHGPGALHVAEKTAGRLVDVTKAPDYTIVNPRRLPAERQLDVCRRCHTQGATTYRPGKTAADFRPGMRLADVMNVFWPRFTDSTRAFLMASHPDRLAMSACFQGSHAPGAASAPMTCTTCHDPHVPIERQGAAHARTVCQACHAPAASPAAPAAAPGCAAPMAERTGAGDDCVACHMPASGTVDIPNVRITDHFIRIVRPEEVVVARRLVRLASLVDPSPSAHDVADGYLTYYEEISSRPEVLDSAAAYLERAAAAPPSGRDLAATRLRLWFFQKRYLPLLDLAATLDPAGHDGWTWYRAGEAAYQRGRYTDAARYFGRAVDREPRNLRFLHKQATALSAEGRTAEALAAFDALLQANPKFDEGYNNRGFTRLAAGDLGGAESDFLAALALDPDAEQALANLASLYLNTGRADEARAYAGRLLRLRPGHAPYEQLWSLVQ